MGLDCHCIAVTDVSLTGAVTHMGDGGATDLHTRGSHTRGSHTVTPGIITVLNAVCHTSNPCRINYCAVYLSQCYHLHQDQF